MSEKQKSVTKWILALLALLGLGGGADVAGLELPVEQLEKLTIIGAGALIAYLHLVWLPLVKGMNGKLDRALARPGDTSAADAVADPPAAASRGVTPALGVVRNKS